MKLLKSKILLGVMIFAVMFVGFAVVKTASATECDLGTVTLKQGMSGTAVTCLQTKLAVTPMTGYFGTITKGKVVAFQAANSLTADGIVGPLTKAALGLTTTPTTALPAGCTAGALFSSTTGDPCTTTTTTTGTTTLSGGAGDVAVTKTSTDVESEVAEGKTENVLGFKVEADGSDVAVTNAKLTFKEQTNDSSSYRIEDYIDSVSIYKGSTKIGSIDSSDFSKDGTTYSKSIALSNAVVKDGDKDAFYVKVDVVSNLDSNDEDKMWDVTLDSIRFADATGVIMSTENFTVTEDFKVVSLASSGDVKLTISKASTSPAIGNVEVSDSSTTSNVGLLDFKLKAAGSDMSFDTVSVVVVPTGATSAQMVDSYYLYNGSDEIASTDTTTTGFDLNNDGDEADLGENTAIVAVFDLDDTFTIDADDTETFSVKANMLEVDGANFTQGDSLIVKLLPAGIEMENENGDVVTDESGSAVGSEQSFYYQGAIVTYVSDSFTAENIADHVDGTISMKFKVTAFGDNDIVLEDDASDLNYNIGGENETGAVLSTSDLVADNNQFTITAGDSATFTLSVKFNGTAGFVYLELAGVDTNGVNTAVSNIKTANH